ncbi:MAG: NTP transferase domain-containing protein [Muribaculaceae bacterium]|nr:NTP transferase domain-containing protein [Muribaculaceae bacterium]
MKAMILCAGLGTRLKPWTDKHPKALVPVGGIPMLQRVVERLSEQGFDDVTLNVHHFAFEIMDFIKKVELPVKKINVSDETNKLLETGGGILHAEKILSQDSDSFLVHNVDILSNANLKNLYKIHQESDNMITLLVSDRKSDRKLVFDDNLKLKGWINIKTGQTRPETLVVDEKDKVLAFSGIYIMSPKVFSLMRNFGFKGAFPIMDLFLSGIPDLKIYGVCQDDLDILDIGKPDTLYRANLTIQ